MSNESNPHPTTLRPPPSRRWPWIAVILVIAGVLVAYAASAGGRAWAAHGMRGLGNHGGIWRHDGGEPPSAEEMREQIEFKTEWVLRKLDATPEQTAQIQAIAFEAAQSLHQLRGEGAPLHDELQALVTAETIDLAALEALREQRVAMIDNASRELVRAAGEALAVLTPEQRNALAERFARHHR